MEPDPVQARMEKLLVNGSGAVQGFELGTKNWNWKGGEGFEWHWESGCVLSGKNYSLNKA